MKRMNKDGVLLCELQATAFEKSIDKMESSSEIFIRRFMRSRIAKRLDDGSVLKVISRQRISCSWLMKNMGFLIMVL